MRSPEPTCLTCRAWLPLLAALLLAPAGLAQESEKGVPPGVRVERDLAYIPDGDPAQKLDLYLPATRPTNVLQRFSASSCRHTLTR